jgi:dihydrodipicolinate synthase/N-acetylneuraminate lyase
MENRSGIFVGTREFAVPTRNHLSALLAVKKLSDATKEPVTVFNFDRRRGTKLISEIGFRKIRVHEKRMGYRAYLGEVARHKIVFQLDRSRVPGQVAGDALLCRSVCVGGDGAIERIAFPETCGEKRGDAELIEIALRLLTNENERRAVAERATKIAKEKLSFRAGRETLARFFATL